MNIDLPRPEARPRLSRWVPLAVLATVGGVVPIVIAWRFGALGIARNDDWSYLLSSFRFADGGGIDGNGWALMNLVGQLVIALPVNVVFDNRVAPLQVLVAALGVAGLLAVYDLASRWLSQRRALFAASLVALGPMWAALAGSFMTDVPTFSLSMICLAAGARALRTGGLSSRWLAVSLAAGFAGVAVRQYALVAILAVMGAALWHGSVVGRRTVAIIACLGGATVVASVAFSLWRLGLPGFQDPSPSAPTAESVRLGVDRSLRAATLVGFLVVPAVVCAGPRRMLATAWRRSPEFTLATAGTLAVVFGSWFVGSHRTAPAQMIAPGNYVGAGGILGTDVISGVRPNLIPESLVACLAFMGIASISLVIVAGASVLPCAAHARASRQRIVSPAATVTVVALVGFVLACTVPVFFGMSLFDRYLLPVIALAAVIVLGDAPGPRSRRSPTPLMAGVATAGVAVLGLVFACNSASFDGARWRAAERAAEIVGNRGKIDGGFEWINYYARRQVFFTPERTAPRYCIALTSVANFEPRWENIAEPVWGPFGEQAWIVAEQRGPC